jgi:large subunit ribosomal protein L14
MSIQKQTKLKVADNSGAVILGCFHVVGSTRKTEASVGDVVICSVKKAIPGSQVKKGEIVPAVIVRAKKSFMRKDGSFISFSDNAAVVLKNSKELDLRGTRVFGPIAREVREHGYSKIVSLAPEVL